MDIIFRAAQIEDLPILLQFEQGIITAERPFDDTLKPDPISYYNIKSMISDENIAVIVATADEEIIGSAYVKIVAAEPYFKLDQYAYLGFMFVQPHFRGKGVSQGIIKRAKAWAKSRDLPELRLEVYSENQRAIRAYEKAGFKARMTEMRYVFE